jgi:hypothetical protein
MFVDFKAAYDSIDRAGLFKAMEEFHVPRQDLKTLKVTAWWKKAHDRDTWKAVIKEAKAHKGL